MGLVPSQLLHADFQEGIMSGSSCIDVLDDGPPWRSTRQTGQFKGDDLEVRKRWRSAGAELRRINLTVTARIRQ
jgi:hypothetical protein